MSIERIILKNMIDDNVYTRTVIPHLKSEYFSDSVDKALFDIISNFYLKYGEIPSNDAVMLSLENRKDLTQTELDLGKKAVREFAETENKPNFQWLIDESEKFCKDKALYNAMMQSITMMNEKSSMYDRGMIPKILSDALSVSFDPNVGHDYFEQFEDRFEYYHRLVEKLPFDLDYLNTITKGGIPRKTLNIILAGTNVGKSLFMCHLAAAALNAGKNVLYITLELADKEISKRIDANLMNITFDDLMDMPKSLYEKKIKNLRSKTTGVLITKEYPTATASSSHFKSLLNELALKKKFVPDVIFVDYLNICTSARIKPSANVNSYTYVKAIAEELRGLAVEYNVPVWSATQTTRSGFGSSDIGLEDTSESFALPATADFMIALMRNETLDQLNQIQVKQLKNRYSDAALNKRGILGIDRSKMRLYDVEQDAMDDIIDDSPASVALPKTDTTKKFNTKKASGLKV